MERTGTGASHKAHLALPTPMAQFVVLWELFLAAVWLATQTSAHISLALVTVALLAHLKHIDAARDARDSKRAL
jgi:hypothetical protein